MGAKFIGNEYNANPTYKRIGLVAAGSSQTIAVGDMLVWDTNVYRKVTSSADYNLPIVIAAEEQTASDAARYIMVIVPKAGDIFECAITAADNLSFGEKLKFVNEGELVADAAGTTTVAYYVGDDNYPEVGTTIKNVTYAKFMFKFNNTVFDSYMHA